MDSLQNRFPKWIKVQAYKHDGKLHREWIYAYLVEETEDYWALASKGSSVIESDGRRWGTRENAVFILFKKKWMNVIAMFKKWDGGGICYYVNIASPTIMDEGYLRYIDYDLDIKLFPDGTEKTLDENEYHKHIQTYGYEEGICQSIESSLNKVKKMMEAHEFPFVDDEIKRLYSLYADACRPFAILGDKHPKN